MADHLIEVMVNKHHLFSTGISHCTPYLGLTQLSITTECMKNGPPSDVMFNKHSVFSNITKRTPNGTPCLGLDLLSYITKNIKNSAPSDGQYV